MTGLLGENTAGIAYHQMIPLLEGVFENVFLPALRSHYHFRFPLIPHG